MANVVTDGRPGTPMASRTGPVHEFTEDSPVSREAFLAAHSGDRAVPVVVRSMRDPGVVGRGSVIAASVDDGDNLVATIEWPADLEERVGESEPSAYCDFNPDGTIRRVVVELDDDDEEEDGSCCPGCASGGECERDPTGRAEMAGRGGPNDRRQAEMAAHELETEEEAREREQAEMAAGEQGGRTRGDPAEVQRLQRALSEANRKAKADRLRLEELEQAEQERRDANLSEADRQKREIQVHQQRADAAERERDDVRRQLGELRVDIQVEREAIAAGFLYPEDVPKLIDRTLLGVDEDGGVVGVKDAVERLAKRRPELITARRGGGTPPRENYRRPGGPGGNGDLERPSDVRTAMTKTGRYSRM